MFIVILTGLTVLMVAINSSLGVSWNGNNWALGCDFRGNDLTNARTTGEDCGGRCASTPRCTHFTWTNYNGGTCWMKQNGASKNDAFDSSDRSAVCGVIANSQPVTSSPASGSTLNNVLATRHGAYESGACALPKWSYDGVYPVALGDIAELQNLKFKPELCGHILTVNCGRSSLDIVINKKNNSN